ncbi:MAG: site-specific integrase [Methanotrichaceae archaeon]|nr:site-specific integrase [Methanotrichaceae archaeon]
MLHVDWSIKHLKNFDSALNRFKRYLENNGLRDSTIVGYIGNVARYLKFAGTDRPTLQNANDFRDNLHDRKISRSTLNQYAYAIKAYHKMYGEVFSFKRLNPNNQITYFFSSEEILRIFDVCNNLKHCAMLATLFYGALRVSELCNLNVEDVDLKTLTIYVKGGKGGKDAAILISEDCARILREYLAIRPPIMVAGEQALFITDYGNRWDRTEVYRMFIHYKRKANIGKQGGLHVFSRHSVASILVKNGCDIMTIKDLLRHEDIATTARYLHISDVTKREKYTKFLVL